MKRRSRRPRRPRRDAVCPFALPHVPGAEKVACAKRRDVNWLARTTPDAGLVEFSDKFGALTPEGQRYIVAHEQAHLLAGPDHDAAFYDALHKLVQQRRIDWRTAWELERYNLPTSPKRG